MVHHKSRQRGRVFGAFFYDGHVRKVGGSTPTLASLLRLWIKCFTIIISAGWNVASSKLKKSEAKLKWKTRKQNNS